MHVYVVVRVTTHCKYIFHPCMKRVSKYQFQIYYVNSACQECSTDSGVTGTLAKSIAVALNYD